MSYIGKGVETVTFNTATTLDVAGNITLGGTVDGRDVATDGTKLDTITSGAIADILQDTTPQLGGDLDLNTNNVIGTGNINVTGSITGTSFVSTGDMSFTNNSKAIFGTSPSLEIYHDGSNSILDDVGAGNFKMQLAGADKLEITSTGVDVTGTVTADGLESTCAAGDANQALLAYHPTSTSARTIAKFQSNVGGTQQDKVVIQCDGNVGIGNVSPSSYYSNSNQLVVGSGAARQGITIASSATTIGQLSFADGTSGDARYEGWVIYDHNTDHMSFGTSASERMRITSAGNVGIGTSPDKALHVLGSEADPLKVERNTAGNTSIQVTDGTDTIYFGMPTGGGFAVDTDANLAATPLFKIDDVTGNVGIGTTTVDSLLHLQNSDATAYSATATDGQVGVGPTIYLENPANSNATVGGQIVFGMRSTEAQARIGATGGASPALVFGTNDAERLRILSSGGITFNGDTAAANALDDYEEGALSLSSSTGTASFFGNRYTKIGNQVTVRFYVNAFSDLSTATAIIITGLPYAASSSNHAVQGILGTFANTIGGDAYIAYVGPSSSSLIFFKSANNANYSQIQHAHLTSASAQFVVTLTYEAA